MYLSLLVPLDRSSFAEQALPLASSIARRAHARLDLAVVHTLYALEDPHAEWAPFDGDFDAKCKQQEQLYLDATAKWTTAVSAVATTARVVPGSATLPSTVADGILEQAQVDKADLIVMSTHRRGRLNRLGLGSVADELIRRARVPVLLVRSRDEAPDFIPEPVVNNILIPLDGSALAEQVLDPALNLAQLMEAQCTLLRVIEPVADRCNPSMPSPDEAQAESYLLRIAARLRAQGLPVRTRVVIAPLVAQAILAEAEAQASDLIAVATHGRGGLKRWLLGSVADELVRGAAASVLVYNPPAKECP